MPDAMPRFMTIREIAQTGLLSEYCLRRMEKQKRLPCVYSGKRCLINYTALIEQLNKLQGGNR
mgnify:CR=1 FL=1